MLNNKRRFLMDFYTVCVFEVKKKEEKNKKIKKIHKKMLITLNSMKCVYFFPTFLFKGKIVILKTLFFL